ncbi:hypothetical protein HK097_007344 [Rhizophlyctis rosea]|uniref:Uncharacterized protein n=1 Tax=Rhizophlyctis rosea TaxID=64517 RepID=A0AAD5SBS3_9FUNG|nr:hypothetical protein HK097_007344 [Rhizophlyctis rosea]
MNDLINLDEHSVESSGSSGSTNSSGTRQSGVSAASVNDAAGIAALIQDAINEIESVLAGKGAVPVDSITSKTLLRVLDGLKAIDLESMRKNDPMKINGNDVNGELNRLENHKWPEAINVDNSDEEDGGNDGDDDGESGENSENGVDGKGIDVGDGTAGTKKRKGAETIQKRKGKKVKITTSEGEKDDAEDESQGCDDPAFAEGSEDDDEDSDGVDEDVDGEGNGQTPKICRTIAKYAELTLDFKGKVIVHMEDKVKIVQYGGKRDEEGVKTSLMCLEQKSGRLNFTKTMVLARYRKQVEMLPSKYKSIGGRVKKIMDIDPALLLVFYDHPTLIVNFNDSMVTLFSMWYAEQKDLVVKGYSKSVRDFLSAFAVGRANVLEEILARWRKGMPN